MTFSAILGSESPVCSIKGAFIPRGCIVVNIERFMEKIRDSRTCKKNADYQDFSQGVGINKALTNKIQINELFTNKRGRAICPINSE